MRSLDLPARVVAVALAVAISLMSANGAIAQTADATHDTNLLVYHQITNLPVETAGVGLPVLSADGSRAVFSDAPGTGDPATPNRIYVIGADGEGLTEVDAYQTLCYCGSQVDISDDGAVVVSTEAVQLRIADAGGARELVRLTSGELTAIRIAGNGETVFFLVRRDTQSADGAALPRGVWAIGADGGNLRQVVDAEDVAEVVGVPIEETGCCFHADGHPLDVSSDGGEIVFGGFAKGEYVFAVDAAGGEPRVLVGPSTWVRRVAISGDGATVGFDVSLPDRSGDDNQIGVVPFAGGEANFLTTNTNSGFAEPLQLTDSGSHLLISPHSLLIDTETGATRQLGVAPPNFGGNHDSVLTDGLPRGTMNADASRFLYVMRTTRCADCPNYHEQLATLDVGPAELGDAPIVVEPSIAPDTIPLNYVSAATVQADVEAAGTLRGVGLVALREGVFDGNVGRGVVLVDDGTNGDATAGDGTYTNSNVVHVMSQTREDDTGPRMLRVEAEVETSDGFRHATAVEFGPLTVVAS